MALVAPVPTITKAPTPSQILLLVFMPNPGGVFQNFRRSIRTTFPRHHAGQTGDPYNRVWHPSSHVLVFNHSNDTDWAGARERLPGDRNRVFDRWQTAEEP